MANIDDMVSFENNGLVRTGQVVEKNYNALVKENVCKVLVMREYYGNHTTRDYYVKESDLTVA